MKEFRFAWMGHVLSRKDTRILVFVIVTALLSGLIMLIALAYRAHQPC